MRTNFGASRLLSLLTLVLGIAIGLAASPVSGAAIVGQAAAQSPACAVTAGDPPIRVWRDGRFAGP